MNVASILLRLQIPTRVFKERKGLYSEKSEELHSEEKFVILSRQTQQGIPGKLRTYVYASNDIPVYLNVLGCHEEGKNESSGRLS